MSDARQRELLRQRLLLDSLWLTTPKFELTGWLRDDAARAQAGLRAYRGNGRALAERALAAAFPTVAELVGSEAFAGLARAFWQQHPPADGDIATHGAALPEFIAADAQLAGLPYLADVARLDWAVHRSEVAADADVAAGAGLDHLAADHAADCTLRLRPGTVVLPSDWPIVTLWQAHRSQAPDRFEPVREALAQGRAEAALVHRDGWRVAVQGLDTAAAQFTAAVLAGQALGAALDQAGEAFAFDQWLLQALQQHWLLAVLPPAQPATGDEPWTRP